MRRWLCFPILFCWSLLIPEQAALAEKNTKKAPIPCAAAISIFNNETKSYLVGDKRAAFCRCFDKNYSIVLDRYVERALEKKAYDKLNLDDTWKVITKITMSTCLNVVKEYFSK